MPRTPEANELIRRASREKILKAAMELFMKKGYHATSIDDVAKEANVSKGLLYNYFKGKEGLLEAIIDIRIGEVSEVMDAAAAKPTPAEQLRHIMDGALDNVQRQPQEFRFYLHLLTQPEQDTEVSRYTAKLNAEYERQFEVQSAMFERLGASDPRKRSVHFSATLQGIMLMLSTYPKGYPLEEAKAQVIRDFIDKPGGD